MDEDLKRRVDGRLAGVVAIVTGGGAAPDDIPGIGFGICAVLAAAGAPVVVFDRSADAAQRAVDRVTSLGFIARPFVGDITSSDDCSAGADYAVAEFGRLDILVNNAAVLGRAHTLDAPSSEFSATLDVNVTGAVRMASACMRHMGRGGSIVNISSSGAFRACDMMDYAASKGALLSMTTTMAVQLGPAGVRVNSVCPGNVWTPMAKRHLAEAGHKMDAEAIAAIEAARARTNPLLELGTAWDIALAVLYLASADARWVTGQALLVDGGRGCVEGTFA